MQQELPCLSLLMCTRNLWAALTNLTAIQAIISAYVFCLVQLLVMSSKLSVLLLWFIDKIVYIVYNKKEYTLNQNSNAADVSFRTMILKYGQLHLWLQYPVTSFFVTIHLSIYKNPKRLSVSRSVCATVSVSINPLPSDRLCCCDRYIRCQRSLAVKPLNSRPAMYIALQLLGMRDVS